MKTKRSEGSLPSLRSFQQMKHALTPDFFSRPAPLVAPELLGKALARKHGGKLTQAIITEVEAYEGEEDKACHGRFGITKRNEVMFGPSGYWYVYFIYGMYWMLNIVTGDKGHPSAVLIRGAGEWDGPGKLTRDLCIDGTLTGKQCDHSIGLWIEDHKIVIPKKLIKQTPRIGVSYAGEWAEKKWRFVIPSVAIICPQPHSPVLS